MPGERFLYIDESEFAEPKESLATGLLATDVEISQEPIEEALANLSEDPDRHQEPAKPLDDRTLERGYFHASDDSKNAHSHLCRAIQEHVSGGFRSEFFHADSARRERNPEELTNRLTVILAALQPLNTRRKVHLVFENHQNLTVPRISEWFGRRFEERLHSIYDLPQLPLFFPDFDISIGGKEEPGLQCCDFLLWAVNRHVNGKSKWVDRVNSPFQMETSVEDDEWGSMSLSLDRQGIEVGDVHYTISDFPQERDQNLSFGEVVQLYEFAEERIGEVARRAEELPDHANHLRDELVQAAQIVGDPTQRTVETVAKIF